MHVFYFLGGGLYQFLQYSHTLYLEVFSFCHKTKLIDASSCQRNLLEKGFPEGLHDS